MITCNRSFLEARCNERGYKLEEVMPCVISQNGDEWTIDTSSQYYPSQSKLIKKNKVIKKTIIPSGPGTELKKLLSMIGIKANEGCSCNSRAKKMDEMEAKQPGWCEQNINTIIGWLREEAEKRKLPFVEIVAKTVVKLAIKKAKKNIK